MGRYSNAGWQDKPRAELSDDPWTKVWVAKPIGNSNCFHNKEECSQLASRKSKRTETKQINQGAAVAGGRVPCTTCYGEG